MPSTESPPDTLFARHQGRLTCHVKAPRAPPSHRVTRWGVLVCAVPDVSSVPAKKYKRFCIRCTATAECVIEIVGSVFERWRVAEPDPRRIILAKWHQRERLRVYQKRNSDGLKTEESAESTARSSAAALAEVLVQYASH